VKSDWQVGQTVRVQRFGLPDGGLHRVDRLTRHFVVLTNGSRWRRVGGWAHGSKRIERIVLLIAQEPAS